MGVTEEDQHEYADFAAEWFFSEAHEAPDAKRPVRWGLYLKIKVSGWDWKLKINLLVIVLDLILRVALAILKS